MSIGFFIVARLFRNIYGLTIWNIIYSTRKQKERTILIGVQRNKTDFLPILA